MAKKCFNHGQNDSVTMCHQCHKPICKSCVIITPQGSFCTSECSILYRGMSEKLKGADRHSGGKKSVLILLVLVMGVMGVHLMARSPMPFLRSIDIAHKLFGFRYPEDRGEIKK